MSINNICRALMITSIISASSVDYGLASNSNKKIEKSVGKVLKAKSAEKRQQAKDDAKKRKESEKDAKRKQKEEAKRQKEEAKRVKKEAKAAKKQEKEEEKIKAKDKEISTRNELKDTATDAVNKAKECILKNVLGGSINLQSIDAFYNNISSLLIKVKTLRDREDLYTQASYATETQSVVTEFKELLSKDSISNLSAHSSLIEHIDVISKSVAEQDKPSLSSISDILSQLQRYLKKYARNITEKIRTQTSALIDNILDDDMIWGNNEEIDNKVNEALEQILEKLKIKEAIEVEIETDDVDVV